MPYLTKAEAEAVRIAGMKMSNWLYNMRQTDPCRDHAISMGEMVHEWDAVAPLLRKGRGMSAQTKEATDAK